MGVPGFFYVFADDDIHQLKPINHLKPILMKITNTITKLTIPFVFFILSINNTSAQNVWLNDSAKYFSYEFLKPDLSGPFSFGFFSGSHHLMFAGRVGKKTMLIGNTAVVNASYDDFDGPTAETGISNVYLGLRLLGESGYTSNEIGVFVPLADDSQNKVFANTVGAYSDLYNVELYAPDTWGVRYRIKTEKPIKDNGVFYALYGGLTFLHNTEAEFDNNMFFLDWGGMIGYRTPESLNIYVKTVGRIGLNSASEWRPGDKTTWAMGFGASYRTNNFEPGLSLQMPMDQPFKDILNNVLAISLVFHID